MADWTLFNSFKEAVAEGSHDIGSDTIKVALTNTAPAASNTQLSDITQIAATGGYAAATMTINSSAQSGGTYTASHDAVAWTASGADFDPFRYLVVYDDTSPGDLLIAYADYGTNYTLPDGQSFTINAGNLLSSA